MRRVRSSSSVLAGTKHDPTCSMLESRPCRLETVHWPTQFVDFIQDLNTILLLGVEKWLTKVMLPLTCWDGPLSAYAWLMLTIWFPVLLSLVVFAMAALAVLSTLHRLGRKHELNRHFFLQCASTHTMRATFFSTMSAETTATCATSVAGGPQS